MVESPLDCYARYTGFRGRLNDCAAVQFAQRAARSAAQAWSAMARVMCCRGVRALAYNLFIMQHKTWRDDAAPKPAFKACFIVF